MQSIKVFSLVFIMLIFNITTLNAITASQSSTRYDGVAVRAIDGNTDGKYGSSSTTHTNSGTQYEWLLIDLESIQSIDTITLWNRTNTCCDERLGNVRIMVSDTPFTPDTTLAALNASRTLADWEGQVQANTNNVSNVPFLLNNISGRYILIQKPGGTSNISNFLSIAEVTLQTTPVDNCPGTIIPNLEGASSTATDSFNVIVPPSTTYYYQFTPTVAGTIQINTDTNKYSNSLRIFDGCGGTLLWENTSDSNDKSSPNIAVDANHKIIIAFERRYTTDITLNIDFTFTANPNTPPIAQDMNLSTSVNTPISFALTATDADGDTIVSFPVFTSPSNGTLSGPEDNMTYTPNQDFIGTDTFTYKAYDGKNYSEPATVTINVYPPATAVHDDYNTTYMTRLDGDLFTNDLGLNIHISDFNTSTILHGTIMINNDGTFSYLPDTHFYGSESFTYTITDEFNNTSTADVNITVYVPKVDLGIVKTAPAEADANTVIEYTLAISSQGGGEYTSAKNVRVRDNLPPNVQFISVTAADWDCSHSSGVVECNKEDLPAGYTGTIVIRAQMPDSVTTSINTASITSDSRDINPANSSSSAATNIKAKEFDLSISKTVSQPTIKTATTFTYTLNISNIGEGDATQVKVIDNLDSQLGFISIDGGDDWVCGNGQNINCDYEANTGIFTAGTTAAPIVITVISPSSPENISNTATVSAGPENNIQNNSASVNVTIESGIDIGGEENLTQIVNKNLNGDFSLIANTNINSNENADYNDNVNMQYVDADNNPNTFNSSSSTLQIDDNYTVVWAGLFWQGHICSFDFTGTTPNGGGCDWGNSPYANFNAATASNNIGKIQFRAPGGSYQIIEASSINAVQRGTLIDYSYSAYAEVTDIVASAGSGTYWAADIVLTEGERSDGGNYGGWALVTIYEDPSGTLQYKNVSVFKGFQRITTDNVPLAISGFNTPKSGDINASLAFFASDGDPVTGGIISMQQGSGTSFSPISNDANPTDNTLNSTITSFGTAINPGITRTYGVDADRLDVSSFMTNSQTSTNFLFSALVNNTDYFSVAMFTFATDLTTPKVDNLHKRANIISRDGSSVPANSNTLIYPGSFLEYMISFTNTGDEIAEAVEIFDDFDDDGLSNALDLDHFDRDEIKLYHASDTSGNPEDNPDCYYDAFNHRVSCNVASLAIGDTYTMRFVVKVINNFGDSILDKNATNTAYAKYRNPNTNAYVNLYTTPQGEEVGGKSDAINSGVFTHYVSNYEHIWVDAINSRFSYTGDYQDRNITTKIANKKFDIQLVHLNEDKQMAPYAAYSGTRVLPMHVLITLEKNGAVAQPINDPSSTFFRDGNANIQATNLLIPRAYRATSLKMAYIDWKRLLSSNSSACSRFSNDDIAMQGLLPCFYSYDFVQEVMPLEDYSDLSVCYNDSDRDGITDNGSAGYPCDGNAYDFDGTPNTQITPLEYNHKFGCFQCITQSSNQNIFVNISSDDFAVKPDYFDINSSHQSFPDLLRAGVDYNISIVARDGLGNPTKEYNTTDRLIPSEAKFYRSLTSTPNDTFDANALDDVNFTIGFPTTFKISDGETNSTSMPSINYPNVAIRNIGFTDPYWAAQTDRDDTPEECNATKNANNIPIETGRNICTKDDAKVRFIPHHFDVTATLTNHRNGSGVTYLSNDLNMSAHIRTTIIAKNEQNATTTNFKQDYYENPMTLDFNVTDWNTSFILPPDRNETPRPDIGLHKHAKNATVPTLFGFGENNDTNGTHTISANDTNTSRRLMFNYARDINRPKNPFVIQGSEVNITVGSKYTSTIADEGSANINGTGLANRNATFVYARARPTLYYYGPTTATNVQTPIMIQSYCDRWPVSAINCPGIDTTTISSTERRWSTSTAHSMNGKDGNITLSATSGTVAPSIVTINAGDGGIDNNITVSSMAPVIVDINFVTTNPTDTSSWLIYNKDANSIPNPFYQVEFINGTSAGAGSDWTGEGKTGHVVGDEINSKQSGRLGW